MKKIADFIESFGVVHSTQYRRDIDGLRGLAVMSVVICHGFPKLLPGGFVGVDIFFVISGYLISSILIGDLEKDRFSLLKFYDRRIRRIFPALVAVLVAAILAGWLMLFRPEFEQLGRHLLASTGFSENFLLWSEASYFDVSSAKKPLLHLWSLAIEEQFYIVWPLVTYLIYRGHIKFITAFLILGTLSFAANMYYVYHDMTPAYYSPLSRGWELMVGACLAYLQKHRAPAISKMPAMQSLLGLSLLIAALVLVRPEYRFPGFWAIAPTLGTALLISGGDGQLVNRRILSFAPLVWIGLISYPLYLWHWLFLSFGNILVGYPSTPTTLMLIAASICMATLTFLLIERPFRSQARTASQPLFLVGAMVAVVAASALIALHVVPARLDSFDVPTLTEWDFLKNRTPDFDPNGMGLYEIDAKRRNLALFIGDSHLAQYSSRIARISGADNGKDGALMAIGGGCIPITGVYSSDIRRNKCWPLRDQGYRMANEDRFRTVIIGGAWNWYFFSDEYTIVADGKKLPLNSENGRKAALLRLGESIKALQGAGKKVVFVLDNPLIDFTRLIGRSVRLKSTGTGGFTPDIRIPVPREQARLHAELAGWAAGTGATVIDPFGAICDAASCQATSATGQLLYRDDGHFNPAWAVDHAGFIDTAIGN